MAKTGQIVLWGALAVGALAIGGPAASGWAGRQAGHAGASAATAAVEGAATGAGDLCGPDALNHWCAVVPPNSAQDAANLADVRARTAVTTIPTPEPKPYGPPRGEVRELPSARPPTPPPPVEAPGPAGGSNLPQLGEGATEGGLLGKLPVIGKALTEGLKALPPGEVP